MTKSRSKSKEEQLKGEIRKLQKELKRKEKREYLYKDLEEKEAEILLKEEIEERKQLKNETCPLCQGELETIGEGKIKIFICTDCDYRKSKRG